MGNRHDIGRPDPSRHVLIDDHDDFACSLSLPLLISFHLFVQLDRIKKIHNLKSQICNSTIEQNEQDRSSIDGQGS